MGALGNRPPQEYWTMFSRQEQCIDDQIICWNCEEAVHQSAIVCPYCNVELHRHPVQKASEFTKIATLPQPERASHRGAEVSEGAMSTIRFLCCLMLMLAGSSLFFLAILVALFSRGGSFTLSWPEHCWSAFFGLGLSLLSFGAFFLQKVSGRFEDA